MKLRYLAWGLLAAGVSLSCSSVVWAASPVQGMGSATPGTQDRSVSPRWHVYTFVKDGIEYVQVNDTVGRVRAGIAATTGVHLVLPMGVDAERVSTPEAPLASGAIRGSETVYKDALVTLSVGFSDAGQYVWTVADTTGGRYAASNGDLSNCKQDPNSCPINRRVTAPAMNLVPADDISNCKQDPNSCPINRANPQVLRSSAQDIVVPISNCKQDPNSCPINRIEGQ